MTEHDKEAGVPPDDRELEEFLAGRGPLSRAWREGEQAGAPPELDSKVLELARAELRRSRPRRLLRWDGPLALAASTLVVLGLAWLTQSRLAPAREEARERVAAVAPMPAAPAASPSADQPQREAQEKALDLPESSGREPAAMAAKPAPAPAKRAASPQGRAETQGLAAQAPPVASPVPEQAAPAADAAAAAEQDRAALPMSAPPPPPLPAAAPFPASPPQAASLNAPAASAAGAQAARAKAAADPCASTRRAAAQRQAAPEARGDGAAWLEQIRGLRDAGAVEPARAELACFTARNPRVQVPEDLRPLLTDAP